MGGLIEFDTKIDVKRYIVDYEGNRFHIGFAQHGTGYANAWKADAFRRDYIDKKGDASAFQYNYVDDDHSQAGSDAATVVNAQNYGAETTIPMGEPRYHPNAAKKGFAIPLKGNGAPNFSGHLAKVASGQKNVLKNFSYSGSYAKDFAQADILAGFTKKNPRPENTTWHHVEDYNSNTNTGTLQLVRSDAHKAANPHTGGASQYRAANNRTGY